MSEKHEQILNDYFDKGLSLDILEAMHGRSSVQIQRLIRQAEAEGRTRTMQPRDRRSVVGAEPLSRIHKRIGMRFIRWRDNEKRMSTGQAAAFLEISRNRYASLEAGIHNFTMLELVVLCERLGWSIAELLAVAESEDANVFDLQSSSRKVA